METTPQSAKDLRQLAEDWRDYRYYVLTTVASLQQGQMDVLDQLQKYRSDLESLQRAQDILKWKIGSVAAVIGAGVGTIVTLVIQFTLRHL